MRALIQALKNIYIPPLSKLYFERLALEKVVYRTPLFVRISDPDSWLIQEPYRKFQSMTSIQLQNHLESLECYLVGKEGGSIFAGDRTLSLNSSLPYIEWRDREKLMASTDFLGGYSLFIDYQEFEGEAESFGKILKAIDTKYEGDLKIVVIGALSATQVQDLFKVSPNSVLIQPDHVTHASFVDRFKFKNKNTLTLFSFGSRPYFLVDPQGQLLTFFSRQDQSSLLEELKKYINNERVVGYEKLGE